MEKYLLPNYKRLCNLVVVYPNNLNSLNGFKTDEKLLLDKKRDDRSSIIIVYYYYYYINVYQRSISFRSFCIFIITRFAFSQQSGIFLARRSLLRSGNCSLESNSYLYLDILHFLDKFTSWHDIQNSNVKVTKCECLVWDEFQNLDRNRWNTTSRVSLLSGERSRRSVGGRKRERESACVQLKVYTR